jgi:hypothetical protein
VPIVVPEACTVRVEVFSSDGQLVLDHQFGAAAGYHEYLLDASRLSGPGLYTYKVSTASENRILRMIVVGE